MNILNMLYDIIIVGASKAGIEYAKTITDKKVLFISTKFPADINRQDNIYYLEDTVTFASYNHGMFVILLASSPIGRACSTSLVVASGTMLATTNELKPFVTNLLEEYQPKNKHVIIFGNNDKAATTAIEFGKAGATVFLISEDGKMCFDKVSRLLISNLKSVTWLPRTKIKDINILSDGQKEVVLSSYEILTCNDIFDMQTFVADIDWIKYSRLVKINDNGNIIINEKNETGIVPNLIAIGTCAEREEN